MLALLIACTALMLAASAGLKLRATSRLGMGLTPLSLLEAVASVALLALLTTGSFTTSAFARWSIPAAFVLLVTSSVHHAMLSERRRKDREASEARRLATFVGYPTRPGRDG